MAGAQSPLDEFPNLKIEAQEAIKDISFAIFKASVAEDSNERSAFINLTTKELEEFSILLTVEGYKVEFFVLKVQMKSSNVN